MYVCMYVLYRLSMVSFMRESMLLQVRVIYLVISISLVFLILVFFVLLGPGVKKRTVH